MDLQGIRQLMNTPTRPTGAAGMGRVQLDAAGAGSSAYIVMPPKQNQLFKSGVSHTQEIKDFGVTIKEELGVIGGYVADLTDKQVKELEKKGYTVVSDEQDRFLPPIPFDPSDFESGEVDPTEVKEAKQFKQRPEMANARFDTNLTRRFTGKGVTIAVIDTGVHPHPDLQDRLLGQVDFVSGRTIPYDDNGHGTHVAGDAAAAGMIDERFKGPAPDAKILSLKVLGADGSGATSNIIKAIQFAIENKDRMGIRVINMSLGHTARKDYENDPVNQAVQAAHEAGIVVVAAAGNEGPGRKTIAAPGDSPFALTVGAADDNNTDDPSDDTMAEFSSRGPTPGGLQKPDLVAPGVSIMAPMAPMTSKEAMAQQFKLMHESIKYYAGMNHDELKNIPAETFLLMGLSPDTVMKLKESEESADTQFNRLLNATSRLPVDESGAYIGMPGTSMATPIVAGVVAQMLEANPDLTPDQVKEILTTTADKLPDKRLGANSQGAGMVDPNEALMVSLTTPGQRVEIDQEALLRKAIEEAMAAGGVLLGEPKEGEAPEAPPEGGAPAPEDPGKESENIAA